MPSTYAIVGQNLGSLSDRSQTPTTTLGHPAIGNLNDTWVYVHAAGVVDAGAVVVDASFEITEGAGSYTADDAFAAGDYGWVRKTTSPF